MPAKQNLPGGRAREVHEALRGTDPSLAETYANADAWWRDCAERGVSWWAEAGVPFTADDVRDLGVPDPDVANRWGALFSVMRRRGIIRQVGYTTSTRAARNGGVLRVWQGPTAE